MSREQYIYKGLLGRGFSPSASLGILSNIYHESGHDYSPTRLQGGGDSVEVPTDGHTGYGLFQWTSSDRQQGLIDFGRKFGKNPANIDTQLDFMVHELGPDGQKKLNQMTPEESALHFNDTYERPAYNPENRASRESMATKLSQTIPYGLSVGGQNIQLGATLQMDDPNEKIDWGQVMSILQAPKQNVSASTQDALREHLVRQAHHKAMGRLESRFYEDNDQALMKSALAKAEEEAKLNNQNSQLTGVGKLAQMIANSNNSSNSALLSSLGASLGVKLDPMANRYMSQNALAMQNLEWTKRDADWKRQQEEAEKQRAMVGMGGGISSGGGSTQRKSGSSGGLSNIANIKFVDEAMGPFNEVLEEIASLDKFDQSAVDKLMRVGRETIIKLTEANDEPYTHEKIRQVHNNLKYLVQHIIQSESGNKLEFGLSQDEKDRYLKK